MFNVLVLASTNANKILEIKRTLKDFPVEIKSIEDFGPLPPATEDGTTFDENAYKKAYHYAKVLGLPALADDSGLVVPALDGAPGVYSARFAGDNASDIDNCALLLKQMRNIKDRRASFVCVLSIAVPAGPALTYEASCNGTILEKPRGTAGFGYDPLFYYGPLGKTFAELSIDEKNKVSHRGKVLQEFSAEFSKVMVWIKTRMMEELPEQPDHDQFKSNDWSH